MDFNTCACSGKSLGRLLQPAVMAILAKEPLHGYLIAQRLRKLSMYRDCRPDFAGLYRALNGMEEQGLLRAEWDTAEAGPARRRYELTRTGRDCLATWARTLKAYRRDIDDLIRAIQPRAPRRKAAQ